MSDRITDGQLDSLMSPFLLGKSASSSMIATVITQLVKWLKQERERGDEQDRLRQINAQALVHMSEQMEEDRQCAVQFLLDCETERVDSDMINAMRRMWEER